MTASTPRTPASKIRRTPSNTPGGPKVSEEKILVTVRLRPLSSKEQATYDLIAWDCTDDHTIVSRNLCHERHTGPYTFDKVFDPFCSTQKVYEEGARDVALSAMNGINSTIFAYGQTSSGKTFTMRGITENAVKDIYDQIKSTMEKEFVLKFSALEIYNETVADLLNRESGSLRLLDDPEKGTIVEKLTEEVVIDAQHLRHLINICEAQRQVGETSLNDKSSRSHYKGQQLSSSAPAYAGPYISMPSPAGHSGFDQREHPFRKDQVSLNVSITLKQGNVSLDPHADTIIPHNGVPQIQLLSSVLWTFLYVRAMKSFKAQTGRGNQISKVKHLAGSPKQPGGHECGYVVMRYMK